MSLLRWLDTSFSTQSIRFNSMGFDVSFMVDSDSEEGFGFPFCSLFLQSSMFNYHYFLKCAITLIRENSIAFSVF
jgi:hypothetical protein